jgi:hypothetical protein
MRYRFLSAVTDLSATDHACQVAMLSKSALITCSSQHIAKKSHLVLTDDEMTAQSHASFGAGAQPMSQQRLQTHAQGTACKSTCLRRARPSFHREEQMFGCNPCADKPIKKHSAHLDSRLVLTCSN